MNALEANGSCRSAVRRWERASGSRDLAHGRVASACPAEEFPLSCCQTRPRCARCTLSCTPAGPCEWCAHDPADPDHVAVLRQVQERLRSLSRARREYFSATGAAPMGACPACGQFGGTIICDWCSLPRGDAIAMHGLTMHARARDAAAEARKSTRKRRRAGCARCRLPLDDAALCPWCGHDPADEAAVAPLGTVHGRLVAQRRRLCTDAAARRAWHAERGLSALGSCAACGQWERRLPLSALVRQPARQSGRRRRPQRLAGRPGRRPPPTPVRPAGQARPTEPPGGAQRRGGRGALRRPGLRHVPGLPAVDERRHIGLRLVRRRRPAPGRRPPRPLGRARRRGGSWPAWPRPAPRGARPAPGGLRLRRRLRRGDEHALRLHSDGGRAVRVRPAPPTRRDLRDRLRLQLASRDLLRAAGGDVEARHGGLGWC
jgi:hypothetical protein